MLEKFWAIIKVADLAFVCQSEVKTAQESFLEAVLVADSSKSVSKAVIGQEFPDLRVI